MKHTKFHVNAILALLLTVLTITSCKKENQSKSPVAPEKTVVALAEEDHLTITPERQKVIDFFNKNKNARGQATGAVAAARYRSFTVNYSGSVPNDIKALVNAEIDQLYTTSTTSTTRSRMTGAPINVHSSTGGGDLFYVDGNVYIVNFSAYRNVHTGPGNVIFHELIHYLHDRWVSGGFDNSTILNLYSNAKSAGIYASSEYILRNHKEYLAVSAEANYCNTNRPPYNSATLGSLDPNCKNYLISHF
jgi:hypothetical protein